MSQASFYCPQCERKNLFQRKVILALKNTARWHCSVCGFSDEKKYLANPNLREQERQEAAYTAIQQAYQPARPEFEPPSFSPRVGHFLSNYKYQLGVCAFAITLGVLIISIFIYQQNLNRQAERHAEQTALDETFSLRVTEAKNAEQRYKAAHPDIEFTAEGNAGVKLSITAATLDEQFVRDLRNPANPTMQGIQKAGFETVVLRNGRREWSFNVQAANEAPQ